MDEERFDSAAASSADSSALATTPVEGAGKDLARITFPIEQTHILMFARAIGDERPVYVDPDTAGNSEFGGIIAPPTFVQAAAQFDPGWPLRPKPGEKWIGSGRAPTGLDEPQPSQGRLHAEQHFEYFRPIRPGDVLTAITRDGESWTKQSRRAGLLRFAESLTEFRNQAGELVCISRRIVMTPGRPLSSR